MATIPSIDFSPFLRKEGILVGEDPTPEQLEVSHAIDKACREHGFLHLQSTNISQSLQDEIFCAGKELFALDDKVKCDVIKRVGPDNIGFAPFASETLNRNRPPDLKEAMNVRFPPAHTNDYTGCPPSFEQAVNKFLPRIQHLISVYLKACALALDLPTNYFCDKQTQMDLCTVRILHAPPCDYSDDTSMQSAVRVGEHTDFGAVTFLFYDESSAGLQIKPVTGGGIGGAFGGEEGGWIDINVSGGGVLVNTGALMARWTNDEWRATAHRVIVPSKEAAEADRYSLACFVDPDAKVMVDVHDKFVSDDNPKKYVPITSFDYLMSKLRESGVIKMGE